MYLKVWGEKKKNMPVKADNNGKGIPTITGKKRKVSIYRADLGTDTGKKFFFGGPNAMSFADGRGISITGSPF